MNSRLEKHTPHAIIYLRPDCNVVNSPMGAFNTDTKAEQRTGQIACAIDSTRTRPARIVHCTIRLPHAHDVFSVF